MLGAIQWFRFYYARAGRYRIRKRVRVRLTRTRSLGLFVITILSVVAGAAPGSPVSGAKPLMDGST